MDENSEKVWKDRFNAYKKCLQEHRITYNPNLIAHEWSFELDNAELTTKQLIKEHPEITALIYGNDYQAYGGLKALREMQKKVPEEMALIGFDDMEFNRVTIPTLSSVHQPIDKMAELGLKMLLDSINNKDFSHKAIELEASLTLRGSCIKELGGFVQ